MISTSGSCSSSGARRRRSAAPPRPRPASACWSSRRSARRRPSVERRHDRSRRRRSGNRSGRHRAPRSRRETTRAWETTRLAMGSGRRRRWDLWASRPPTSWRSAAPGARDRSGSESAPSSPRDWRASSGSRTATRGCESWRCAEGEAGSGGARARRAPARRRRARAGRGMDGFVGAPLDAAEIGARLPMLAPGSGSTPRSTSWREHPRATDAGRASPRASRCGSGR